ncbi:hypothetical protein F5X99DRAFT_371743 [Biscogniauxia marginata]|nr:hypothetical protein F5X99DRAFT_371743 [Biscogniauxia marginata]
MSRAIYGDQDAKYLYASSRVQYTWSQLVYHFRVPHPPEITPFMSSSLVRSSVNPVHCLSRVHSQLLLDLRESVDYATKLSQGPPDGVYDC